MLLVEQGFQMIMSLSRQYKQQIVNLDLVIQELQQLMERLPLQ